VGGVPLVAFLWCCSQPVRELRCFFGRGETEVQIMVLQGSDSVLVRPLCRNWGNFIYHRYSILPVWFGRDAIII